MARFASLDEGEITKILVDKNSENTKKATGVAWTVFNDYIREKELSFNLSNVKKDELDEMLKKFHLEMRKKNGSHYAKQTFKCIRSGIHRKIKEVRPDLDILDGKAFLASNEEEDGVWKSIT